MLENTNQWISDNDELLKQRIPEYVESFASGVETAARFMGNLAVNARRAYIFSTALMRPDRAGAEAWRLIRGEVEKADEHLRSMQDYDLQGNISGLEGIDRLTDRIEDTGAAAEGIAKSIQTMAAKTDKMGQSFDVLTPSFLQVVGDLEEQRKQLLMTEVEWEKYQRVLKSGVDPTSDRADEIRNMVDRIYEMRRAMEWDEKAGAPAGIGPEMAGEHDEEMRRILDRDKDTREGISSGWQGLVGDMENAFDGWASYYSRELNDMLWDSEFSFKRIAESFGRMITEMLIQSAMADIMGELFGTEGKNGEGGKAGLISTGINAVIDAWTASAKGNVFSNGQHLTAYARGGIVDKPTVFPMARGVGLMGEAGPEAVMPLTRTSSGDLGVKTEGSSQQQANNIKIINVLDPSIVGDYMATNEGERVIMNIVQKNQG
jgi:hypothetical protein